MKITAQQTVNAIKFTVSGIVGIGTTKIVRTIIENNVEPETTKDKVTVGMASVAIGMMAADATKKYTNTFIDEAVELITNLTNRETVIPEEL